MKIAYEQHGEGSPIVLLHAFPLSSKMWSPQIEALKSENFRLILPDLRGFGETNNFADINTMEDMANDVAELLDNLQIKQAVIGGLSMGGYVAFNLFRLQPERFRALVLCGTNCSADTKEKRENRYNLIEAIESKGAAALIDKILPNLISTFTKENNRDLVEEVRYQFEEVNPKAAIAALRGMAERADHCHLLKEIKVPTLLIFGEDDEVTNLEIAQQMQDKIGDSRLFVIEKAGHYSNLEQSGLFNQAIVSFIKQFELV